MFEKRRCATVVVVALGLIMFLGSESTSLASAVQQDDAQGQSPAAASVGPTPQGKRGGPPPSSRPGDRDNGADLSLRLAWFDVAGLPENVTAKMKPLVAEIFAQVGIAIEWYEPPSVSNPGDVDPGYFLKVMLYSYEPGALGHDPTAMGVVIGDDFPPDAVWLFDPAIRRALEGGRRRPRPLSSVEKARAYAKVVAHEVLHALAADQRHAESGLMAPTQNSRTLLSSSIDVDEESVEACRRGLERIVTAAY